MTTKYVKYLIIEPAGRLGGAAPRWITYGARDYEGAEFSLRLHYLTAPYLMIKEPHSHDFDQFYLIIGADLANARDFQAESSSAWGRSRKSM